MPKVENVGPSAPESVVAQEVATAVPVEAPAPTPANNKPDTPVIRYTLNDPAFGELAIFDSERGDAWWLNKLKLETLIIGFKKGYDIKSAIALAGITRDQYYYFRQLYPQWDVIKELCDLHLNVAARDLVYKALVEDKDVKTAKWYLEHTEFKGDSKPTNGVVNNFNFGDSVNQPQITKVKPSIAARLQEKKKNDGESNTTDSGMAKG